MAKLNSEFQGLDDRSREIFREIVESYLANGTPVGTVNGTDLDLPGDTLSYSITNGDPLNGFVIDARHDL